MKRLSLVAILLIQSSLLAAAEGRRLNLGQWLAVNEPRVVAYLGKLTPADIGTRLTGVVLVEPSSPGDVELEGYLFVGQPQPQHPGSHVYKFRNTYLGNEFETHYIWLDPGAAPMDFPPCAAGYPDTGAISDLAGEQYTTSRIVPGLIVKTSCPLATLSGTTVPGSNDPE